MEKIELSDFFYYLALAFQFATLIIITLRYKKVKSRFAFFFAFFIYVTCLVEGLGLYYWKVLRAPSVDIYNIYLFFEFNLISLMYLSIIKDARSLKLIKVLNILFNSFYVVTFFYEPLQTYSIILESLVLSIFFISYLRELLVSDKILNYKNLLPFWITCGFLIFYLSSIPFQLLRESMQNRNLFFIPMFLIYIMHTAFIYGLIWRKEVTKY